MIKLELEVTTKQLVAIAAVLADGDHIPSPGPSMSVEDVKQLAEDLDDNPAITIEEITQAEINAGNLEPEDEGQATGSTGSAFAAETTVEDLNKTTAMNSHLEADTPPPPPPSDIPLAKSTTGVMIPWDARIHGAAKKINAGGDWKLLKGVDRDNLVPQVEAELAALMAGKPSTGQTTSHPVEPQSVSADTPPPPPPSSLFNDDTPPPPPPAEESGPKVISTFPELLPLVTGAKAAGTLTDERINQVIAEIGLTKFGELAVRTDLVAKFAELAGVNNG